MKVRQKERIQKGKQRERKNKRMKVRRKERIQRGKAKKQSFLYF